jgi:hypothetical protein
LSTDLSARAGKDSPIRLQPAAPNDPYLEGDPRISHALIHWMGLEKPTHLLEWWASYRLLRSDELAEAEFRADIEPLLVERGLTEGAVQVKESFGIAPLEEEERDLLRPDGEDDAGPPRRTTSCAVTFPG